jgi:DNA polymerase-1
VRTYNHRVAGEPVTIRVATHADDLHAFNTWWRAARRRPVGFDTEATGLDVFAPQFRTRLAQFGLRSESWVLPIDPVGGLPGAMAATADALNGLSALRVHNAPYDAIVSARHIPGVQLAELWPKIRDTRIDAHLLDPRSPADPGGIGQGLEALTGKHIDAEVAEGVKGSMTALAKKLGVTKAEVWRAVALDDPDYELYAGMDPILAVRLDEHQAPRVDGGGWRRLSDFEHAVALVCLKMQMRGMRLDVEYTEQLVRELTAEADQWSGVALRYGVTSVNAPAQVSAALTGMGEELTETTDTGALSVGKDVLLPLADLNVKWERLGVRDPNPLAEAVLRAKRSGKWSTSYAAKMLEVRDANDRVHPVIASLKARTARMSISEPPLQQLPSQNWTIRQALLAEPGHVIGAVDYQAVEMRVLAALANDRVMIQAILDGEDLHGYTARLVYGDDYTDWHRKVCKGVGFGKVYGGGAEGIAKLTGAPLDAVQAAIRAYDRHYRGIRRYSKRLQDRAEYGAREVITKAGRRLPLDRRRLYAATNYMVQSTARDILAQALLIMDEAGLTEFLRLPIHDECVFSAPRNEIEEVGREVARCMRVADFEGVPLDVELTAGGPAWGSLYRKGEHRKVDLALAA